MKLPQGSPASPQFLSRITNKSTKMAFISIVTILYFAFIMSQCRPLSYFWTDYSGTHGKCYDLILTEDITIIYSVCAAATDLTLGILPLFVIYSLRINRKAKIVVGFLLCLGIVLVILSALQI